MNAPSPRISAPLDREWRFCYDPEEECHPGRASENESLADYSPVALPHTWHTWETTRQAHPFIRNPSESDNPYWWNGWGWYRKVIRLSGRHRGRLVYLEFDGVQKVAHVFVNGVKAAMHRGGYGSFSVEITGLVRWDEPVWIAIAVSARRRGLEPEVAPMNAGNWNVYGGIYRSVRLVLTNAIHIPFQGSADEDGGTFVRTPQVCVESALVQITAHVRNASPCDAVVTVAHDLLDQGAVIQSIESPLDVPAGVQRASCQEFAPLKAPRLWSPAAPHLYQIRTRVSREGEIVDQWDDHLGLRWFHWDYSTDQLYLNGCHVPIHGTNRHQEYPWLGDALPQWLHERDMRDIHENLGHNFVRFCHYTQDRWLYDYCDRHGIVVCEEVPNIKNLPFDPAVQRQQVVEMIRRDRNHPSILMWSLGNETDHAAAAEWALAEDDSRILHYRHVRGGDAAKPHTHENLDMENLLRCTIRGWPERAAMDDSQAPLPEDHENGQMAGTEAWQAAMACRDGGSVRGRIDREMVAWIYADHGADREYGGCPLKHVNPKGWVDAYRQPKYLYYLWQAFYAHRLMVFVQPHWWQRRHLGGRHDLVLYANADEVELLAGDRLIGRERPSREVFQTLRFPGVLIEDAPLRAVASRDGETIEHIIPMAGPAARLALASSHATLPADRAGVALIHLSVLDEAGEAVPGAHPPIFWGISGPGRLLAPAEFMSDIDQREAKEGTMYIVAPFFVPIRTTTEPGIITLRASSPGLAAATVSIESTALTPAPDLGIDEPAMAEGDGRHLHHQQREGAVNRPGAKRPIPIVYADLRFENLEPASIRSRLIGLMNADLLAQNPAASEKLLMELTSLVQHAGGTLIADDYNFHVGKCNDQIAR